MKTPTLLPLLLALAAQPAAALDLTGQRQVILHGNAGERLVIASVRFSRDGDGWRFTLSPDRTRFGEYFLAMRPFLCLDGETQSLCHFPQPAPGRVTAADLTDLEYALMFIRKPRAAVNLDPFYGVYYRLEAGERGLAGKLYEVDLNPVVAPEGRPKARPIAHGDLVEVAPAGHWLPGISIE